MAKPFRPMTRATQPTVSSPRHQAPATGSAAPRLLDVGSGRRNRPHPHPIFAQWSIVRLDIDKSVEPDLVGSITDLRGTVPDASFDAVWSSHNIEHLYTHELPGALSEMKRVLKPHGFALLTCPDLEQIGKLIAGGDIERTIYTAPAGPISVIDMLFGHTASITRGNLFMAHHTGFTVDRLGKVLQGAGFAEAWVAPGPSIDLWAAALMPQTDRARLKDMLAKTEQRFLVA